MSESRTIQCDCGHESAPRPEPGKGGGVGYARSSDGRTLCYPCADDAQRADRDRSNDFVGYLSASHSKEITTWTGGLLARVTSTHSGRAGFGGRSLHVEARDERGGEWYGWRSDAGWSEVIRMHRRKATPPIITD